MQSDALAASRPDFQAQVGRAWQPSGVEYRYLYTVDRAAAIVDQEIGWSGRLWSNLSTEQTEQIAKRMFWIVLSDLPSVPAHLQKEIIQKITQQMGKHLAKSVSSRIISKFIPGVGWALFAVDLWAIVTVQGTVPDVAKFLRSENTQQKFKQQIASALAIEYDHYLRAMQEQAIAAMSESLRQIRLTLPLVMPVASPPHATASLSHLGLAGYAWLLFVLVLLVSPLWGFVQSKQHSCSK